MRPAKRCNAGAAVPVDRNSNPTVTYEKGTDKLVSGAGIL
jgi:hypothetical protein